mgnify:CR=1 FL=1
MKKFNLLVGSDVLSIVVADRPHAPGIDQPRPMGQGDIFQGLTREVCIACGKADCFRTCGTSVRTESLGDALGRIAYNAFLDAIESVALAHACAGVDIGTDEYVEGMNTALEAASNNY